jgi:cell division protein FtsZ
LLEQTIHGARGLLVNVTSGEDLTLAEVTEAMAYIHSLCDQDDANIFFGTVVDPNMEGEVRITVLATGFNPEVVRHTPVLRPATAVVEAVEEPSEPAASTAKDLPNDRRISPRDIWEKAQAGLRDATQPQDVYDDSEIDIPAFLRQHRQQKP